MTLEEIYQELAAQFQARTGRTAGSSSELAVRFYAVAAQIYGLYLQAEWTKRQCFPQTAQGEELDKHAQLRGIVRRQAVPAAGTVRFYVDQARETDTEVPEGTVCMTAGGVRFLTDQAGTVPRGELYADLPVTAAVAGETGNVPQGSVIYMALPPTGIAACVNPEDLSGGQETEEDAALRERVMATFRRLANGANSAFYRQAAMAFDGVSAVAVLPQSRGVGTVDIVAASRRGVPDSTLLAALQDYFEQVREIAVDVKVLAPTVKTVDVTVKLWTAEGEDYDAVAQAVRERLKGWFTGERLGQSLLRAELTTLAFGVPGVANCAVTAPETDLTVGSDELPALGTLTILRGAAGA